MRTLVGREHERTLLAEALTGARDGAGRALLVHGEPGIGKTALLEDLAAATGDIRLLMVRGRESEQGLGFAALADLVEPLRRRVAKLPPPQATALLGALAIQEAHGIDRFAVAAATFSLIAAEADERPVLLIVDDAQWLDPDSLDIVLFVAHRLTSVAALFVLAARDGEPWPHGLQDLHRVRLHGLSESETVELLSQDPDRTVSSAVATELVRRTSGNPLALLELRAELDEGARSGRRMLGAPLPVGPAIERLFLRRVAGLPAETQAALLRAAVDADVSAPDARALEPAEQADLVAVRSGRCEFRHPLVRSAVYHAASEAERRRAHAAVADGLTDAADADRRALHRALASAIPDDAVADELEASAGSAMKRGGVADAAERLELAAELSVNLAHRARRLAAAASAALFAGDAERARRLLAEAERAAPDEPSRVAVDHVHGIIQLWTGQAMDAHRLLVATGERAAAYDRGLAATILIQAVWPAFTAARIPAAISAAARAHELAAGLGGLVEQQAGALLGSGLVLAGEAGQRPEALIRVGRLVPRDAPLDAVAPTYALTLVWLERFEEAAEILQTGLARARAAGAIAALPLLLAVSSELAIWRGNLRAALAAGVEAENLCEQIGVHVAAPYVLSTLARAEAMLGHKREARVHAERALAFARPHGIDSIEIYAACALGLLDLGLGRYRAAIRRLEPLRGLYADRSIGEANAIPWLGDLAEAGVASGDHRAADGALRDLDAAAERTGSRWAEGVAARARGARASPAESETLIARAMELLAEMPLERARALLVLGMRRQAAGERAAARAPLREALAIFERAAAVPWADRARRDLVASGEPVEPPVRPIERLLSPQELQVVLLAAEGATNREAAARLIVSPKTIEYHLGNAYRKLGVRSRVELMKRLASA